MLSIPGLRFYPESLLFSHPRGAKMDKLEGDLKTPISPLNWAPQLCSLPSYLLWASQIQRGERVSEKETTPQKHSDQNTFQNTRQSPLPPSPKSNLWSKPLSLHTLMLLFKVPYKTLPCPGWRIKEMKYPSHSLVGRISYVLNFPHIVLPSVAHLLIFPCINHNL